jgi:ABC-type antimicrobial peptide transport system permease subunit
MAVETLIAGLAAPRPASWARAWQLLRAQNKAIVGGAIVLLFLAAAVFAPLLAPYPPAEQNFLDMMSRRSCTGWH